jgi:aminoglycoside phosphotransferase (APT) family kinase protein
MEAYTFRLQLGGLSLPQNYRGPLILRLYASSHGLPSLRHESAVQAHMTRLGFPVARPVHIEEDEEPLDGPFMLMKELPGRPMLESLFAHPWEIFAAPFQMGALHARLHALPTEGFPTPEQPFLARWLNVLQERINAFDLPGLQAGLDWLRQHRPADPERPSILHLDFHPINVLYDHMHITGVLDWPEADVGDPHADIATTLMLAEATEVEPPNAFMGLLRLPGAFLVRRWYLRGYWLQRTIDWKLVRYYGALAALRRLTRFGMWRRESPEVTGSKPTALTLLADGGVKAVERFFRRQSGIRIHLHVG